MKISLTLLAILLSISISGAQQKEDFQKSTITALEELIEFVAIPNDALNHEDILANIAWLQEAFGTRGFSTSVLATSNEPLLLAQYEVRKSLPTVLFYMHLDGQAVDSGKWDQANPYKAVLKKKNIAGEWEKYRGGLSMQNLDPEVRLFGRSAADDKAPIVCFLQAFDLLKEQGFQLAFNIKVILDSEEEKGSIPLPAAVKKYKDLFAADALIINDGPMHITNQPTLIYGCRGNMRVDLTMYGPILPQHSGHYGNYAPNPNFRMARLLSSMKDEDGRVLIKGYYDGIELTEEIKKRLAKVPDDPAVIHNLLQIVEPEKVGANYQESLQYPSLNVRGMLSGWVGMQARTIVPAHTVAAIDIRLVPESDPDRLVKLLTDHIKGQGYHVVKDEPGKDERMSHKKIVRLSAGGATLPFRTEMDSPTGAWLTKALKNHFGQDPIEVRIMGGTVPVSTFIRELNIPAVIVPMVNADNNQHAPNENMRIGNITNAIETFAAILKEPMK